MSWAKLDDRANQNPKLLAAGAEACWFWACGLMYANSQPARDGVIPELALAILFPVKNPKRLAAKLVEVGLWDPVAKGYRIHDYHVLNPTKEQYEASLSGGRARASKSYEGRKAKNQDSSPEDSPKNLDSSGVEWSGGGAGSDLATTEPTLPVTAGELQSRAALWLKDRQMGAMKWPNPEAWPETRALVSELTAVFGGAPQGPRNSGDPRMTVLLERWAEGRTNEELTAAIRGAGQDGLVKSKPQLQNLKTILRDSAEVDRYARLLSVSPTPDDTQGARASDGVACQLARAKAARELEQRKALP